MSFQLIYGAAGTGKSTYILNKMKSCAAQGGSALLIVPEQFSHIAETQLIGAAGFLSPDIQATSFARLARRALADAGRAGAPVDAAGKHMLMARVLSEINQELTVFRGAWEKPGFLTTLLDLISDFKRAQLDSGKLSEYAQNGEENPLLRQKLAELGLIYARYEEVLSGSFADAEDNVTLLAKLIMEQSLFVGTEVYLDGFFRFTANELDVVRSLLSVGASVVVSVCASTPAKAGDGIFEPCHQTAARLCAIARESGAQLLPPICLTQRFRFQKSPELAHLESQLYRYPNEVYPGATRDVSLFTASDPYSEVVWMAVQIRRAVCNSGIRYRDVAIIAGNLERYQNLIKTVFPSYEIPVFTDTRRELLSHPVMLMLFSLFRMLNGGFRTQDVIAYSKTGYSGLSAEEADRLENYALQGRVERGDWLDDTRFLKRARMVFETEQDLSEVDSSEAERMLELKNRLFAPVLRLKEALSADRRTSARAAALFAFIEETGLRVKIEEQAEAFERQGLRQLADEYADVYNLLIETLDQLVLCLGDEAIGLKRLQAVLETGFSQYSMGVIPSAADQVFLGDVNRSVVKNVKLVFLAGAVDGAFPPAAPTEGILTDDERVRLRSAGFELAPDTKKIAFDNQFLVYNAVNISSGRVCVSFPVADFEGKGLRPSPLVSRLRKLFPGLRTESDLLDELPDAEKMVASRQSAYRYVLGRMAGREAEPVRDALKGALGADAEYRELLARAEEYSRFSNQAQRLSRENVTALYGRDWKGSVSRFERFAACPFSYFVQYGLRAKERKVLQIETPDIGWLLHAIVDAFSRRMLESGESYQDMTLERCGEIVDRLIREMSERMFIANLYSEKKLGVLFKRLRQMVMKSVWVICEHVRRGEFEPCAFEVSFDENGEMPPVTVELPTGERITLAGRIDRIDQYRNGAELYIRIIDYKSGNKEFRLSDVFHRLSLQLAVYLTAACENGESMFGQAPKPAGMFYFRLSDPVVAASGISEEKLQEEVLKKYKMSGLVLSDADIIRAMDKGISGYSKIIPVRLGKDGVISANSKSATMQQMDSLKSYIKRTIGQIGREILNGNAEIMPCYDGKNSACEWCKFKSVCGFDNAYNRSRYLPPLADEEVWGRL